MNNPIFLTISVTALASSLLQFLHLIRKGRPRKSRRMSQNVDPYFLKGDIQLGDHSYKSDHAWVRCWHEKCVVMVGKYCSIASCKFVYDGNHNHTFATTFPFKELCGVENAPLNAMNSRPPPMVGHDVWICDDAIIYAGVNIGHGAVVAGQAVVTKDVPPYAIVGGNPAKVIKYRFPPDTIKRFLSVEWWHLPHQAICDHLAPLMAEPEEFLKAAEMLKNANT
ncbi:hypothetical protein CEUSTIGMA_g10324.t1 [Chlamydomonas eustigma]|uniref:Uncharacterized protein n=1 Tax=Chlamydomonas eustigma TaxID=1157962 RepID=A0A250XII9_9CHLO|nr:hypothetical protein CEUSTIGMA_g10324.t1 [Chlamydomonas eustigma]|eukprot:GAX82898.1 hypothetical protein CEUSTIGMA_g10324.t1 [Chlamydomonas eustigma]